MEDFITTAYNLQLQQLRIQQPGSEFVGVLDTEQVIAESGQPIVSRVRGDRKKGETRGLTKRQIIENRRREQAREITEKENTRPTDPAAIARQTTQRSRRPTERQVAEDRATQARAREIAEERRVEDRRVETSQERQPPSRSGSRY